MCDVPRQIGMVVTEVDEGSAADVAGVLEGWAVTSINEEDVSEVPFWDADARSASSSQGSKRALDP